MSEVRESKNKRRRFNVVLVLLLIPFLAMLVLSLRAIGAREGEHQAANSEYIALRELAGIVGSSANNTEAGVVDDGYPQDVFPEDNMGLREIDFDALHDINPDIIGWIVVPGTSISYPIVQGHDNEWYLYHTVSGEQNVSGSIFMDYNNAVDFSDEHTLVYGHNMQHGNMFAPLHGWNGEIFRIYTPDGVLEYEVFARHRISAHDPIYATFDSIREDGAQVVTLSTCTFRQPAYRFVVQGVLIG